MIIAVDFDGTCVEHKFPLIGKDIGAIPILKRIVNKGHQLILWTMRSDGQKQYPNVLTDAVNWFKDNDILLYGVNSNPTQRDWTLSPKCYAQLYIDDCALGIPMVEERTESGLFITSYVDWKKVEQLLLEKGIL